MLLTPYENSYHTIVKILFTRFPYESAHGGAESQTIALMSGLQARGHAVAFLGSCPTLLVLCQQYQIPYASLDIGLPPVSKQTALSFIFRKRAMQQKLEDAFREFQSHELDVVCMLSLSEKLLLTETVVESGVKVFWIEHDTVGKWLIHNPYFRLLRRLSTKVTTIGVSELSKKIYIKLGWDEQKVVAIPNGIDPKRFVVDTRDVKQDARRFHIGCVARLAEEKGLDVLITSLRDVPSVSLSIVGLGREHDALKKLVRKLDMEDRVTIESRKGNMAAFYSTLDLLVLPSRRHDPFGLVVVEAMMLGIPVVVTEACGVASQLMHGKDAIIVKPNSSIALTEGISSLLNDPSYMQRIAKAGQKKALSDFTEDSMIDKYEELLKNS